MLCTYARRRDDSDAPGDRYRLYEIAGAPHADASFYPYMPTVADQKKTGFDAFLHSWPFPDQCEQETALLRVPIMTYALDAAYANLTRWVRDGVPAPRAARVAVENGGTPQARVVLDQHGNAVGGVRTPHRGRADARPISRARRDRGCAATWRTRKISTGRRSTASTDRPKLRRRRWPASVDRLVRDRWLTESDGRKIKAEVVVPATASR